MTLARIAEQQVRGCLKHLGPQQRFDEVWDEEVVEDDLTTAGSWDCSILPRAATTAISFLRD